LRRLNEIYDEISHLFTSAGIANFEKLPDNLVERGRFAKLFKELNDYLEAAKIQGFKWSKSAYSFGKGKSKIVVTMNFDENTYLILALRYKELFGSGGGGLDEVPFEIDGYLTQIDTGKIDSDYMNSRFEKYLKTLKKEDLDGEHLQQTLDELHKSFASLTQEEQKFANIFIHDVQSGNASIKSGKTFREYITEYQFNAKNAEIYQISQVFGLDEVKLRNLMSSSISELNINEYGRFDDLKNTVDKTKAKEYFEKLESQPIPPFKINIKVHNLLQAFIISGGFEV
jgi:type I restriction enzyme, R subunit